LRTILQLPVDPEAAIAHALARLAVPENGHEACLTAWLLDLNGWAAVCAWWRWQARLGGGDDTRLVELLAIRAVWDVLSVDALPVSTVEAWARDWAATAHHVAAAHAQQAAGWERLEAEERELQARLIGTMSRPRARESTEPSAQAVFCIDVRSEVLRRALEMADPTIATRGFAGFFGLPAAYRPLGTQWQQPQLPGLLSPAMTIEEQSAGSDEPTASLGATRRARLTATSSWEAWRSTPATTFSFVESCGLFYAGALVRASLPQTTPSAPWARAGLRDAEASRVRSVLALEPHAAVQLALGVLRAMGLVSNFAPLLLLCGHGGQSTNNPHAATLDCGACGGQSGEVNARALAALLNDATVRDGLRTAGIDIPCTTHVMAGLHNTTTDEVQLFDLDTVPAAFAPHVAALSAALAAAGAAARAERAPGLGLLPQSPSQLLRRLQERAAHWAETRPEWALADNAAFIAAPRSMTCGGSLEGRVFLHDYNHRLDADLGVLTLILSAPMVVAHWINLQYLTSVVDPLRQGAGNKLLHNVVGGGVGVFEGNGGDLRIGLPWQSVHDGERLRHTPLRLSVFVAAPRAAIDAVIAGQDAVRKLVDHGWLHLFAIEGSDAPRFSRRRRGGGWEDAC
jgi:uncharacterized protein YbcC (UPF0753/DUF2309 family)